MQVITANEIAITLNVLNNVIATMEPDPKLKVYTSNDALLIVLTEEQLNNLKSAIKKLSD